MQCISRAEIGINTPDWINRKKGNIPRAGFDSRDDSSRYRVSDEFDRRAQTTAQFTECVSAGAQIVSIRPAVLHSLLLHPLTDRGVDRFLSGLSKRPKARE